MLQGTGFNKQDTSYKQHGGSETAAKEKEDPEEAATFNSNGKRTSQAAKPGYHSTSNNTLPACHERNESDDNKRANVNDSNSGRTQREKLHGRRRGRRSRQ